MCVCVYEVSGSQLTAEDCGPHGYNVCCELIFMQFFDQEIFENRI